MPTYTSSWPTQLPSICPAVCSIYAKGEASLASYKIRYSDKWLEVAEIDLSLSHSKRFSSA